jgi:hypothetical protein
MSMLRAWPLRRVITSSLWVCNLVLLAPVHAANVVLTQGDTSLERGEKTYAVVAGMQVREDDVLRTKGDGELFVRFDNGARMLVRAESAVHFLTLKEQGAMSKRRKTIQLVQGGLRYVTGKGAARHRVAFKTETSTIGIRGTDLEIVVAQEAQADAPTGTYLQVNRGAAVLEALDGTQVHVERGEQAFGGEPELTPKGLGAVKQPAGRKLQSVLQVFKKSGLDALLQ